MMGSHYKILRVFSLVLLSYKVSGGNVWDNGEKTVFKEFILSNNVKVSEGNRQLYNSALHPYLYKLLTELGKVQSESKFLGISNRHCLGHLLEWAGRFGEVLANQTDKIATEEDKWALHLVDSWAKIPEGILSGHINAMGDFHECIEVRARNISLINNYPEPISRNFEGRYCTTYLLDYASVPGVEIESEWVSHNNKSEMEPRKAVSLEEFIRQFLQQSGLYPIVPTIGVCMPNSCSKEDIQNILIGIYQLLLPEQINPEMLLWPVVGACYEEKKPDLDAGTIAVIVILSVFGGLCLAAGTVDFWLDKSEKDKPAGLLFKYFFAFSWYTNTKKWMSTRRGAEDFGCLFGIRFFSTAWVIIGHTYESFMTVPPWNMFDLKKLTENWAILVIANGTFCVDTFFALSGALAAYSILRVLDKSNGKLNLIMFYVHRYIRLTPAYAIMIGITATILVRLGSGPFWMSVEWAQQTCQDNWWANLLYINNIYKLDAMCINQSWYLSNDMQFYILSPFIVYPLWRKEKIGLGLLSVYTILSCISPILIVRYHGATPAMVITGNIETTYMELYFRPWARIQPFLVGIWLGYILFKTRGKRVTLHPLVVAGLWLCSTATACAILFGIFPWFNAANQIPEVGGYFYAAFSRFTWAIVVCWIIFACIKGYGGIVNSILSWKPFMPLGRLSYCVYLTSLQLQTVYHGRFTQAMRYDTYTIVNTFFGHLVMCHIAGFIFTIIFESPFIILQKLIFEGGGTPPKKDVSKKENA